jgi:hypothetical protein
VAPVITPGFTGLEDRRMVRLFLTSLVAAVLAAAGLAGCKTENAAFCANPANAGVEGCPGDATAGGTCGSDGDCKMTGFPACDLAIGNGTCKACTASSKGVCAGKTPHCDSNDSCVACVDDVKDCGAGGVCMPDGGCADTAAILHASSTSNKMNGCGDMANPCSLPGAIGLVAAGKTVIKLDDAGPFTAMGGGGFVLASDLTLDARGAMLVRSGAGSTITVMGGKTVTLLGGTVHGTAGGNAEGIKCNGNSTLTIAETVVENSDLSGVTADMCTLTITRATLRNNSAKPTTYVPAISVNNGALTLTRSRITSNSGGGLSVMNSPIVIVSNIFFDNGSPGDVGNPNPSAIGGMNLSPQSSAGNLLEFNTIVGNRAQIGGNGPGIHCVLSNFTARNNILWMNNANTTAQTGGNCIHSYSDLGFVTVDLNNNIHIDPVLTADQHLAGAGTNPMLGKADPATDLGGLAGSDIDGQPRAVRSGMGADIGADQYLPAN